MPRYRTRYRRRGIYRKRRKVRTRKPAPKRRRLQTVSAAAVNAASNLFPVAAEAYKQYKRYRSGTKTRMRNKDTEGTGAYNQWSQRYAKASLGRLTLNKILKNVTDITNFTWQRFGRFGDNGQLFLQNFKDTAVGFEKYTLPVMIMDLTSCLNYSNGSLVQYSPMWQLQKSFAVATAGRYQWIALQGQTPAGINNTNWQLEYSTHRSNTQMAYPNGASILKWASINLELWGMKNHPTKYTIEVCRFAEDVVPTTDMSADQNYNEFWDSMTKQYTYSPLSSSMSGYNKKKYSVIRRYNVNIDPTASFENDSDPHVKTFKIFLKFNRKMNYAWKYSNAAGQTAQQYESSYYEQEDNENQTVVHPNARIFLMIRASNYNVQTVTTDISNANTPSISIKCRTQHILGT